MDDAIRWVKSSHSRFASSCVEVGVPERVAFRRDPHPSDVWAKSSHSSFENDACVEVALGEGVPVLVRDTQNRGAAVVGVGAREWSALISVVADRG